MEEYLMKKIAVLRCLRVSASCTGSGCLRALNEKTGAFERYGDETLQAAAVFTCNGCGENKLPNQEGINKKVERIIKNAAGCTAFKQLHHAKR